MNKIRKDLTVDKDHLAYPRFIKHREDYNSLIEARMLNKIPDDQFELLQEQLTAEGKALRKELGIPG